MMMVMMLLISHAAQHPFWQASWGSSAGSSIGNLPLPLWRQLFRPAEKSVMVLYERIVFAYTPSKHLLLDPRQWWL